MDPHPRPCKKAKFSVFGLLELRLKKWNNFSENLNGHKLVYAELKSREIFESLSWGIQTKPDYEWNVALTWDWPGNQFPYKMHRLNARTY